MRRYGIMRVCVLQLYKKKLKSYEKVVNKLMSKYVCERFTHNALINVLVLIFCVEC